MILYKGAEGERIIFEAWAPLAAAFEYAPCIVDTSIARPRGFARSTARAAFAGGQLGVAVTVSALRLIRCDDDDSAMIFPCRERDEPDVFLRNG